MATTTPGSTTPAPAGLFKSAVDIRTAHTTLLEELPEELGATDLERVADFIRKAVGAGAVLDSPDDRRQTQGLIDYWAASLFSGARESKAGSGRNKLPSTILVPFNPETVTDTIAAADQWVNSLPQADREVVGRILLRLVRLPRGQRTVEPTPIARQALADIATTEKLDALVRELAAKKVVRVIPATPSNGEMIALAQEALTRKWEPYSRWIDQRLRFRDTAKYWDQSGRNSAALVTGELLDRARSYHDLDDLERAYIEACRVRELRDSRNYRVLATVCAALLVMALVGLGFSIWGYMKYKSVAGKLETSNTELKDANTAKDTALQQKADALEKSEAARNALVQLLRDPSQWTENPAITTFAEKDPAFDKLVASFASRLGGKSAVLRRIGDKSLSDADIRVLTTFELRLYRVNTDPNSHRAIVGAIRGLESDVLTLQEVQGQAAMDRLAADLPEFALVPRPGPVATPNASDLALFLRRDRVRRVGDQFEIPGEFLRKPIAQKVIWGSTTVTIIAVQLRARVPGGDAKWHAEMLALGNWVKAQPRTDSIVLIGDFNAEVSPEDWKPLLELSPVVATRDLPSGQGTFRPTTGKTQKLSHILFFGPVSASYIKGGTYAYDLATMTGQTPKWVRDTISDSNPLSAVVRVDRSRSKD